MDSRNGCKINKHFDREVHFYPFYPDEMQAQSLLGSKPEAAD